MATSRRCSTTSSGAVFINLSPGSTPTRCPRAPPWPTWSGNRGPTVPLATWTPGEIGIQHMAGQKVTQLLAERGCPVPEDWYVASSTPSAASC